MLFRLTRKRQSRCLPTLQKRTRTSFSEVTNAAKDYKPTKTFPQRIFSGIQPTGDPHLGNYLGAIKNWVDLQNKYKSNITFCIVDLHSLTTHTGRRALEENTRELTATLLACGIDPNVSVLYNQSKVSGHAELAWLLTCLTPLNTLKAMPQFKDKSKGQKEPLTGLFSYPVLMAADIMLYKATHVPVGEDQIQHIELTRFLAERFNRVFGEEVFPIPEVIYSQTKRVMSLRDASKKMSKSDESEYSRISLRDSPEMLRDKIRRAKTDCIMGVTYDREKRPEVANLLEIFSSLSGRSVEDIAAEYATKDMGVFKEGLTEVLVSSLSPIRTKLEQLMQDPQYLEQILAEGARKASEEAQVTLAEVRRVVGLL